MKIRGRVCENVLKVSILMAASLVAVSCGKAGLQSFYQFSPNNGQLEIDDSGSNPGGSGSGAAGSTSTSSASSSSSSGASSSSSSSGSSSSSSGSSSSGAAPSPTPTPKILTCDADEVLCNVEFKCHTSASSAPSNVQCVFKDKGGPLDGALPLWFAPVNQAAPGCVAVSKDSLYAKLGHLPANTGQYHFSGTLKACLKKNASREEQRGQAILEFMGAMASAPSEGRVIARSPARKGNGEVSIDSLSGTPVLAGYCARSQ